MMLATQLRAVDYSAQIIDLQTDLRRAYPPKQTHTIRPQTFIDGLYAYAAQDVYVKTASRLTPPMQVLRIRRITQGFLSWYVATCLVAGKVREFPIAADQPLRVQ